MCDMDHRWFRQAISTLKFKTLFFFCGFFNALLAGLLPWLSNSQIMFGLYTFISLLIEEQTVRLTGLALNCTWSFPYLHLYNNSRSCFHVQPFSR